MKAREKSIKKNTEYSGASHPTVRRPLWDLRERQNTGVKRQGEKGFVIDYFLLINDYLFAIQALPTVNKKAVNVLRACPAYCIQHGLDFGIGHEQIPAQLRAIVFNHNHNRPLVDGHAAGREPVLRKIKSIEETERPP
jgi:hypothetical protein